MDGNASKKVKEDRYKVYNPPHPQPPTRKAEKHKKKKMRSINESLIMCLSVVTIFLGWYIFTKLNIFSEVFIPSPSKTWAAFTDLLTNGYKGNSLLYHLFDSLYRLSAAFFIALITAVPLGLLSGYSSKIRAALDPVLEFYRPLPPLSYYTLLILWFGIGDLSKIALLFLAAFAPMYIASVSGVKGILEDRIHSAASLGANKWQTFRYVIFPSCLPEIFTGMRTAIGFAYTTLVASEMVAAVSGIGWLVLDASKYLRSDIMYVGIILMGVTGILLDRILRIIEAKVIPWKGKD